MKRWWHIVLVVAAVLAAMSAAAAAQEGDYEFQGGRWRETAPPPAPVAPAPPAGTVEAAPTVETAPIRQVVEGTSTDAGAAIQRSIDAGEYRAAVKAANRYLARSNDPAEREEVMMLAGEAEMKRGRLFQAFEWFEKQLAESPEGRYAGRALEHDFAIAEAFLAGQKRVALYVVRLPAHDEGLDILGRIAEHAPGTPTAERALMRIADDRYQQKEWDESAEAYDRYLTSFMRSTNAAEAMLRAARAVHASFGGARQDETPLIEAEQRYRELARAYPLSASQAGVDGVLEQIRSERAAKMLEEGRFYERIDKPKAAAYTYRLLLRTYPNTDAAAQAELALAGLTAYQSPAPAAVEGRPEGQLAEARPDMRPAAGQDAQNAEQNTTETTTAPAGE